MLAFGVDLWPIMFLGIPLQVAIILWGALALGPRKKRKNLDNSNESIVSTEETSNNESKDNTNS